MAIAELDGIESDLDHIDVLDNESYYELQNVIKEMLDDCSKSNFKKVGKFLIRLVRKDNLRVYQCMTCKARHTQHVNGKVTFNYMEDGYSIKLPPV